MSENTPPPDDGTEFIAAASDGAYTLVVADFADTATAWSAYEALEAAEDGRTVEIEGVVVVKREADGKLEIQKATDHSTKSGLKWGLVGGIALGVIFPPSILGSAAALGAAGAATGKVRQLHHRSELADEVGESIAPGHSGIIALVSDPGVVEIREALALADSIVEGAVDRRRCPRHQGRGQGSRSRGRLVTDRHAPTTPSPGVVWSWSALARGCCSEHLPPLVAVSDPQGGPAIGVVPVASIPWLPCGAGGSGPAWSGSWRRRRCSSAPARPVAAPRGGGDPRPRPARRPCQRVEATSPAGADARAPADGRGLQLPGFPAAAPLAAALLLGAVYATGISLLWPSRPRPPDHHRRAATRDAPPLRVRRRSGRSAVCRVGFALDLEHVGWAPAAALLVMRPLPAVQRMRSMNRVIDVVVGRPPAIALTALGAPDWAYASRSSSAWRRRRPPQGAGGTCCRR